MKLRDSFNGRNPVNRDFYIFTNDKMDNLLTTVAVDIELTIFQIILVNDPKHMSKCNPFSNLFSLKGYIHVCHCGDDITRINEIFYWITLDSSVSFAWHMTVFLTLEIELSFLFYLLSVSVFLSPKICVYGSDYRAATQ